MSRIPLDAWQAWALLSAVFAAATAVLAKVGVEDLNPNYATLVRTVVVVIFIAAIVAIRREYQPWSVMTGRSQVFLILSGIATGLSWLCYFRAIKLGPVSQVAPIDKLSLVLVVLLGVALLGERLSLRQWVGAAFMGVGAVLLAMKK